MPFWLSQTIGTGGDAEGNQFRPVLALYTDTWSLVADVPTRGFSIVRSEFVPDFDVDRRIQPLRKSLLRGFAPEGDEVDDQDALELAAAFARRAWLSQLLGVDDFGQLTTKVANLENINRIKIMLSTRGISTVIENSMVVSDLLKTILPQIRVRVIPRKAAGRSGTFTDDFSNAPSTEDDIANTTPSGGTAWIRSGTIDGCTSRASDQMLIHDQNLSGTIYHCDDQANPDQYVQYVAKSVTAATTGFFVNRSAGVDEKDYIGVRVDNSKVQIFKQVAASFTQLGSTGATTVVIGDTIRMESDSVDAHEAFINGSSEVGPTTDNIGAANTRQGIHARGGGRRLWADDVEFGLLTAVTALPPRHYPRGVLSGVGRGIAA